MSSSPHGDLSIEKWKTFSTDKMLLNIFSELSRAKKWAQENNSSLCDQSIERALFLIDLTIQAKPKSNSRYFLKELTFFREIVAQTYLTSQEKYGELVLGIKTFLNLDPLISNLKLEV